MTSGTEVPAFYPMQNVLTNMCNKYHVAETLSAMDLRNAFIRRRIQAGVDLYSLCTYVGIKQPNVLAKRFAEYLSADLNSVAGSTAPHPCETQPRHMNLLIPEPEVRAMWFGKPPRPSAYLKRSRFWTITWNCPVCWTRSAITGIMWKPSLSPLWPSETMSCAGR